MRQALASFPASLLAAFLLLLSTTACSGSSSGSPSDPPELAFSQTTFDAQSAQIQHPYLPLVAGTTFTYEGETEEGDETVEVYVTKETKVILGVKCIVVRDEAYVDDELVEKTFDWYAQDTAGNIWYLGEDSTEYENGEPVGKEGSWEGGVDGAIPGILIKATQLVGDSYQQEYYAGVAEDMARVVSVTATVTLSDQTTYQKCLQTREWNPLEPNSDEYKYYAPGVGLVLESQIDGTEALELVDISKE